MQTRIHILMMMALVLVATACGDAGAETDEDMTTVATAASDTEAPATAPPTTVAATTTTAAATTTTTTSAVTTTSTIPLEELPALEASLGEPSGRGLLAAGGTYGMTALTVPLRLTLPDERSVLAHENFITIGPLGFEFDTAPSLTFAKFVGFPEPDQVAVHDHPDSPPLVPIDQASDWTGFFEENEGPTLLDSGTDNTAGNDAPWWQFTAEATGGYQCPYGTSCFNIAFIDGAGFFILGEEWTVRLWQLDLAEGTIYAWFQAPSATFADDLAFANELLTPLSVG